MGFLLFPMIWMFLTSIKPFSECVTIPPVWLPTHPTFNSYIRIWTEQQIPRYFCNSLIVALSTAILNTVAATPLAYVFSRFKYKWVTSSMLAILASQMFPIVALLISLFLLMKYIGLLNTYLALILCYTSFSLPFCVWILKTSFDKVPHEMDEAALIDGCSRFGAFTRIILPLSVTTLAATSIFSFIVAWDDLLFALTLTSTDSMRTLPVAISKFIGQYEILWNSLMAGGIIAAIPPLIIFLFLQKLMVQGLTQGAVKG